MSRNLTDVNAGKLKYKGLIDSFYKGDKNGNRELVGRVE